MLNYRIFSFVLKVNTDVYNNTITIEILICNFFFLQPYYLSSPDDCIVTSLTSPTGWPADSSHTRPRDVTRTYQISIFFVWDRVIQGTVLVFIRSRLFLINIYIYSYQECSPSNFWKSDAIKVHKLFSCTLETLPSKFIFKVFYTSIMNAWQVWFIYVIKNFLLFIKWNLIFYGQHVTCIIMLLILDSLVLKKINEFSKSIWFI